MLLKAEKPLIQNTEFPKDAEQKVMGESQIILQLPDVRFLTHCCDNCNSRWDELLLESSGSHPKSVIWT